ncbi:hypothetical protein Angca_001998, partial [Angiostrongylus cantonensis]
FRNTSSNFTDFPIAKHRWAGLIMRRTDDRWTKRTVEWTPRECKRPLGQPRTRWA